MTQIDITAEFNKKYAGKQVKILNKHPHSGEIGVIICLENVGIGKLGIRIKGEGDVEFYVFDKKDLKII